MKIKIKSVLLLFIGIMGLQGCNTAKVETIWVSGYKIKCDSTSEDVRCLNIFKGEQLKDEKWKPLTSKIEGFEFEEGELQKLKVEEVKEKSEENSSSSYSLVEVLEKKQDPRIMLRGNWVLTSMNGKNLNKMIVLPTLIINIEDMVMSGKGGCNLYQGPIDVLTTQKIKTGNIAGTLMECENENIESDYLKALSNIDSYTIDGSRLTFLDVKGQTILSFIRTMQESAQSSQPTLRGKWENTRINGENMEIEGEAPFITFDLEKKAINGKDGCNNFFGQIEELSKNEILFSGVGSTRMMCENMDVPDAFLNALNAVNSYEIHRGELVLLDAERNELLAFDRK